MRKKLKGIALLSAGIMLACSMLVMPKLNMNTVLAADSESVAVATPIGVNLSTTEENELWIGDIIYFKHEGDEEGHYIYDDNYHDYDYDMEILEGDSVKVLKDFDDKTGNLSYLGLECIKTGKSTIKVYFTDEEGKEGSTTYNINVVEGKEITYNDNISMRIGDTVPLHFKADNVRYGSVPMIEAIDDEVGYKHFAFGGYGGWLSAFSRDKYWSGFGIAVYPGEIPFKFDDWYRKEVYGTGTITIEEPVIETNAPMVVGVGDKCSFETILTNINTENQLIKNIYEPKISVIDGEDCVKQTENEYTDFTTSDMLEFIKAGTVKISVKYEADPRALEGLSGQVCSIEKNITIRVAEENEEITEDIEKDDVTIITKENLWSFYKNNNVVNINVTEDNKLLYTWKFAPKDENTFVDVNLKVDMGVEDEKVAKIASRFDPYILKFYHQGALPDNTSIKILVPNEFVNAYVYHLEEDGTATLWYEVKAENGYIEMPLEHCSTYFITKEKIETAENTIDNTANENKTETPTIEETTQTSTNNIKTETPNTGDDSLMSMYILVLVAAVGILLVMGRKKIAK